MPKTEFYSFESSIGDWQSSSKLLQYPLTTQNTIPITFIASQTGFVTKETFSWRNFLSLEMLDSHLHRQTRLATQNGDFYGRLSLHLTWKTMNYPLYN